MKIYTVKYLIDGYGGTFPKEGVVAVEAESEAIAIVSATLEVNCRGLNAKFTIESEDYSIVGEELRPSSTPAEDEKTGNETQELAKKFLYDNKITGWAVGEKSLFYATTIPPDMHHNEIMSQFNQWVEWKS